MDIKQQLEEAQATYDAAWQRLIELKAKHKMTVQDSEMRAMIGKCFKYVTHYGGVEQRVYLRVFDVKDDGLMAVFIKQDYRRNNRAEECFLGYPISADYIPIDEAEHRAAVAPILATIKERAGL